VSLQARETGEEGTERGEEEEVERGMLQVPREEHTKINELQGSHAHKEAQGTECTSNSST